MPNAREIQDWLLRRIAEQLHLPPEELDIRDPLSSYGLSSLDAVTLSGDLEEFLGCRLQPTLVYDHPNILELSNFLSENKKNKKSQLPNKPSNDSSNEPIAVIGMGCRFPGAKDPESFWQLLRDGVDMITEVPADRWPKESFYHPDPSEPGKSISYWGGFLDRVDQFDPFFFSISPMEAQYMDPQHRLLLEVASECLDDAGQVREDLDGSNTGVFIGISGNEYSQLLFDDPSQINSHSGTGSALSIAANRISYFFNFHGPSMAIDTACSSSLAAVHLACRSIRSGECKMALAGGVNIILSPAHSIAFTKAGVLAPDGRCKSFDAKGNGYVRGEGGGIIALKLLSSALADGDHIHGVVLGSGMRQDGRTNGLIAPSRDSQEALLRETYLNAGVRPGHVQYVEAHGTGTLLGDSMEANALGAVIGADLTDGLCAIGSVKTNIGHLEAAAGIAGLIKVLLCIKHRIIPRSLHYYAPNPHIPFEDLHLRVQNKLTSWPTGSGPAIAGVSSFGFGGTNVHMIVGEVGNQKKDKKPIHFTTSNCHLLPLSAQSPERLLLLAASFQEMLVADSKIPIHDVCYAAALRRSQSDYRLAAMGHSRQELSGFLQAFISGEQDPHIFTGSGVPQSKPKLVFVFSGQGGQWFGMGRELLNQEPVFYKAIERIDQVIQSQFAWSLMDELFAEPSASRINEIDVVQPAIFAIQVALADLWQSWGIMSDAVVGHSMGEVAAAYVAGILSLEDAIRVVGIRSLLLKQLQGKGSMLATELSTDQANDWLKEYDDDIAIASINGPASTVLSGNPETIKKVQDSLERHNLYCRLVNVEVASHSPQIDLLRFDLLDLLKGVHPKSARLPIYSTVTGILWDSLNFNGDYWFDNLRKPVLFSKAVGQLFNDGYSVFIELGPHPVLLGSINQSIQPHQKKVRLLGSMRRDEGEREVLLRSLGTLYVEGFSVDWKKLFPTGGKYVKLPLMPWQHQRYWIETDLVNAKNPRHKSAKFHPLLGKRINLANSPSTFVWQTEIDSKSLMFLEDHKINNETVFPATGYIEMALQAAIEAGLSQTHELSDFIFKEKMILPDRLARPVQALMVPDSEDGYIFSIYSQTGVHENWNLHAAVNLKQRQVTQVLESPFMTPPAEMSQGSSKYSSAEAVYQSLQELGVQYGPSFRSVKYVWKKEKELLGRICLPNSLKDDIGPYQIHPAFLDGCLQVLVVINDGSAENDLYIPTGCKRINFISRPGNFIWSHVRLQPAKASENEVIQADFSLLDESNQLIAEFIGFTFQRKRRWIGLSRYRQNTWMYQLDWQAQYDQGISSAALYEKKHWLIMADDEGMGDKVAKQLEAGGDSCKILFYREAIQTLNNSDDNAFIKFIGQHIGAAPSPLYGIIHFWNISVPPPPQGVLNANQARQIGACKSLLLLVQALVKLLAEMPRLWVITRGGQVVKSGEPKDIWQTSLWGLGKVLSFELPELKCVRIDLDPVESLAVSVDNVVSQISMEEYEDQIAFRQGVRFVPRLIPFMIAPKTSDESISFRVDGTYLITGGLGGLGFKTAAWMVLRGAKHLVLMSRSEPSPVAINMVLEWRHAGIEVVLAQADVCDSGQVESVFEKMGRDMPGLRGIVHAAGVLDDGSILNLNTERLKKVMEPKVDGTWNLHHATRDLKLDFFVLFSSAVSVLGSPGQGNYAAACAYQDAFAYYRHNLGLPAISINWGPWAEVGLAFEATEKLNEQNASTKHLIKVFEIDQGLEILGSLLAESTPQVMVLPFDLKNLIDLYPKAAAMSFLSKVCGSDNQVSNHYERPHLRQEYLAPRNAIERKLAELWQQTLHIDRVGVQDSFFELGGDSVLAAQILSMAQKAFGIRINLQDAFKAFTIERLANLLEAEMIRKIESMSEEDAQKRLSNNF